MNRNRFEYNDDIYNDNDDIYEKKISIGINSDYSKNEDIKSDKNMNDDTSKMNLGENYNRQKQDDDFDDNSRLIADDPDIQINLDQMVR